MPKRKKATQAKRDYQVDANKHSNNGKIGIIFPKNYLIETFLRKLRHLVKIKQPILALFNSLCT
jgi:hypothetical protein